MKELYNLLELYFKNDKDIEIELREENYILIDINEKYYNRELNIYIRNENIIISEFIYNEESKNENEELEEFILFQLNHIFYELDEIRLNLLIIHFIKDFIDIIE